MPKQTVHIIYASTSGNVELVAEELALRIPGSLPTPKLRQAGGVREPSDGLLPELHRAEQTDISVITQNELFILMTSTWEHGEINPFFDKLLAEMATADLAGKNAGFVGLGDTRYEPILFCKGIDILQETFVKAGGKAIGETLKINGDPHGQMEMVNSWLVGWLASLEKANNANTTT